MTPPYNHHYAPHSHPKSFSSYSPEDGAMSGQAFDSLGGHHLGDFPTISTPALQAQGHPSYTLDAMSLHLGLPDIAQHGRVQQYANIVSNTIGLFDHTVSLWKTILDAQGLGLPNPRDMHDASRPLRSALQCLRILLDRDRCPTLEQCYSLAVLTWTLPSTSAVISSTEEVRSAILSLGSCLYDCEDRSHFSRMIRCLLPEASRLRTFTSQQGNPVSVDPQLYGSVRLLSPSPREVVQICTGLVDGKPSFISRNFDAMKTYLFSQPISTSKFQTMPHRVTVIVHLLATASSIICRNISWKINSVVLSQTGLNGGKHAIARLSSEC